MQYFDVSFDSSKLMGGYYDGFYNRKNRSNTLEMGASGYHAKSVYLTGFGIGTTHRMLGYLKPFPREDVINRATLVSSLSQYPSVSADKKQ